MVFMTLLEISMVAKDHTGVIITATKEGSCFISRHQGGQVEQHAGVDLQHASCSSSLFTDS